MADIITAGFPCQPHSVAGERRGRDDGRWLWPETRDAIRRIRPRYAVLENVPGLLTTAFGDVLGGLAEIGFDAEWATLRASDFRAPHRRERLFIVAYAGGERLSGCDDGPRIFGTAETPFPELGNGAFRGWSDLGPAIGSLQRRNGFSVQMVRNMVKGCGNSVMPQIAEWIGRRLVEADRLR